MSAGALSDNRLEHECAELQEENRGLKKELAEVKAQLEHCKKDAATQADQLAAIKAELCNAKAERAQLEDEAIVLRQDLKRMRLWESQRETEAQTLMEQLAERVSECQRLLKEKTTAEQKLQQIEASVVPQLEADRSRLEAEVARGKEHQTWLTKEMEAQRQAVAAERKERGGYMCELEAKAAAATLERDTANVRLQVLTEQQQQSDTECAKLRRKVLELQDALLAHEVQYTQEVGTRDRMCTAYATEIEQLKSQLEDLTAEREAIVQQLEAARTKRHEEDAAREAEQKSLSQRCLNAERETVRLRGLIQRLGGAALEEALPAPRPSALEQSSPVFVLSPTAGAVQSLRARGVNTLAETYASGLQALDEAESLRAENQQLNEELKQILEELEARAPQIIANQQELQGMQQAFGAMAMRLDEAERENKGLQRRLAESKQLEEQVKNLRAENKDLGLQLRAVLFEKCCDPQPEELDAMAVAMGLHVEVRPKPAGKVPVASRTTKVTFRTVDELVSRNAQLLQELRQAESSRKKSAEEAVEKAMRDYWGKLKGAQEEILKLSEDYQAQLKAAEVLQSQRDRLFAILKARQLLRPDDLAKLEEGQTTTESGPATTAATPATHPSPPVIHTRPDVSRRQLDLLKGQVSDLEAKLTAERDKVSAAQAQVDRGTLELQEAKEDEKRLRRRLDDIQQEAARLKETNSILVAEQHKSLAAMREALAEAAELKRQLAVSEASLGRATDEVASLKEQLATERAQSAAQREQEGVQAKVLAALEGWQGKERATEGLVQRLTAQVDARAEEVRLLQRDLEAERATRREWEVRCGNAQTEALVAGKGVETKVAGLQASLADAEGRARVWAERAESLAAQLRASEDRVQTLLDKVSTAAGQEEEEDFLRSEDAQLQQAHDTIAELQDKLRQSEARIQQANESASDLQTQLRQATEQIAVWRGRTEEMQRQAEEKAKELQQWVTRSTDEVAEVATLKMKIETLQKEEESLKQQHLKALEEVRAEVRKAQEECTAEKDAHAQTTAGKEAAQQELAAALDRNQLLDAHATSVERQLESAKEESQRLQEEGQRLQEESKAKVEQMEAAHFALLAKKEQLEKEVEALRTGAGGNADALKQSANRIAELEGTIAAATQEREHAKQQKNIAEKALEGMKQELDQCQEKLRDVEELRKKNLTLEDRCSSLSRSLDECQEVVSQSKLQMADLRDELGQAKSRSAELAQALKNSQEAVQDAHDQIEKLKLRAASLQQASTQPLKRHASDDETSEQQPPEKRPRKEEEDLQASIEGSSGAAMVKDEVKEESYSVLQALGVVAGDDSDDGGKGSADVEGRVLSESSHGQSEGSPEGQAKQRAQKSRGKPSGTESSQSAQDPASREETLKQQLLQKKASIKKQQEDAAAKKASKPTSTGGQESLFRPGLKLCVTILDAEGLRSTEPWGSGTPYCTIALGTQQQSTKAAQQPVNPAWSEDFVFNIEEGTQPEIRFSLFDTHKGGSKESLGVCTFDCSGVGIDAPKLITIPVLEQTPFGMGSAHGQLTVSLHLQH